MKIWTKFRKRISQLSFKLKLAISFGICCFITLLIMNIVLQILQITGQEDNIEIATNENQQFINISNKQMLKSFTAIGMSALDRFDNILFQLSRVFSYFQNHPDSYTLKNNSKALLFTKDFKKISFQNSAIYLYTQNSTIHRDQYMDVYMRSISKYVYPGLRRVNMIYYHTDDPNNLMARTYPATSDFLIKNPQQIANRLSSLQQGSVELTSLYYDQFSLKQGFIPLFSLRTVVKLKDQNNVLLLIQVEIYQAALSILMRNIYYFPSTNINFIAIFSDKYQIMSQLKPDTTNLSDFLNIGIIKKTLANGTTVIGATLGVERYHRIDAFSRSSESNQSEFRFIVLSDASDSDDSYLFMKDFSIKFSSNIAWVFYIWAIFVFILICATSMEIGQRVFIQLTNLAMITTSYIKNPHLFRTYIQQFKAMTLETKQLQQLVENYSRIIQKIQENKVILKKPNNENDFSLNMLEVHFQKKIGLKDYQIMSMLQEQLTKRYQNQNL